MTDLPHYFPQLELNIGTDGLEIQKYTTGEEIECINGTRTDTVRIMDFSKRNKRIAYLVKDKATKQLYVAWRNYFVKADEILSGLLCSPSVDKVSDPNIDYACEKFKSGGYRVTGKEI